MAVMIVDNNTGEALTVSKRSYVLVDDACVAEGDAALSI
jgi:ABC-type lipopolysaccharide export system ATPase subunit